MGFVTWPVLQPLALDARQSAFSTHRIVNTELHAVRVAEIKLGEVAVQVLLGAVLVEPLIPKRCYILKRAHVSSAQPHP